MAARESIANQMNNLKAVLDEHDAAIDELTDDSVGHCLHSGVDAIRATTPSANTYCAIARLDRHARRASARFRQDTRARFGAYESWKHPL